MTADLHDSDVVDEQLWDALAVVDAMAFGCPTCMGGPSSVVKAFAEASLRVWDSRGWSYRAAAGFTRSVAGSA